MRNKINCAILVAGLVMLIAGNGHAQTVKSIDLAETSINQKRDISIPNSRLVINPFNFRLAPETLPATYSSGPAIPFNVAYLNTKNTNREMSGLLNIFRRKGVTAIPTTDLWVGSTTTTTGWVKTSGSTLTPSANGLRFSVNSNANPGYQSLTARTLIDINAATKLKIKVAQANGPWTIKLRPVNGNSDVSLRPEVGDSGEFEYNINDITGWLGSKEFDIMIYAIGLNVGLTIEDVRIVNNSSAQETVIPNTSWKRDEQATLVAAGNGMKFTVNAGANPVWQFMTARTTAVIDASTSLKLHVSEQTGPWTIKLRPTDGSEEVRLRPDEGGTGDFEFNLQTIAGWNGAKEFDVLIYSIGENTAITVDNIRIAQQTGTPDQPLINKTWRPDSQSSLIADNNGLNFTVLPGANPPWQYMSTRVNVNIDASTTLKMHVSAENGPWTVKLMPTDGSPDVGLRPDGGGTGDFEFNLKDITGWVGQREFDIKFYSIGASYTAKDIKIVANNPQVELALLNMDWTPTSGAVVDKSAGLKLSVNTDADPPYQSMMARVNITVYPSSTLRVNVINENAPWTIKLRPTDGTPDFAVRADAGGTGTFNFNIKDITGWEGSKEFDIIVYSIGQGGTITLDKISLMQPGEGMQELTLGNDVWQPESQSRIERSGNSLKLIVDGIADPPYQYMKTVVQANITAATTLKVHVSEETVPWTIKLKALDGSEAIGLRPDGRGTGDFEFNIKDATGWTGDKEFEVIVYSIGQGGTIKLDEISILQHGSSQETPIPNANWEVDHQSLVALDGAAIKFTVKNTANPNYQFMKARTTAAIDQNTTLKMNVSAVTGSWTVKLKATDGSPDISIRTEDAANGDFEFNIKTLTGWQGTKEFDIYVYSIGANSTITVNSAVIAQKGPSQDLAIVNGWVGNINDVTTWIYSPGNSLERTATGLKFSTGKDVGAFAFKTPTLSVDLDKTPVLLVNVPESYSYWAIKVNDGSGEQYVQADMIGAGNFSYNFKTLFPNWTGTKQFELIFYSVSNPAHPAYITIGDVRFIGTSGISTLEPATEFTTKWAPHENSFTAKYTEGASLSGFDYFYDENTLVRVVDFENITSVNGKYIIWGAYAGTTTFANNILTVKKEFYSYTVSSKAFEGKAIRYYANSYDLQADKDNFAVAPASGYWAIEIDATALTNGHFTTAVAFSETSNVSSLPALIEKPLTGNNDLTGRTARQLFWDDQLAKVPVPKNFEITAVNTRDVTAQQVKNTYYKAYVHVISNLIPPDPAVYNYPQFVTGKASLWDEGAESAPFTATWESLIGIQHYAYIDPVAATEAFKGIMSLTDASGLIGGESLPSRKAQTAWLLYKLTGDKTVLNDTYAQLERYMNWRLIYPQWIYYTVPNTYGKDAEFVFSALVDMGYMKEIARVVKDEKAAQSWEQKRIDFYNKSIPWFWETPTASPVQLIDLLTNQRGAGHTMWVTTGLYVDLLKGDPLTGMFKRFDANFGERYNFFIEGVPKYPDLSYTVYGLLKRGKKSEAEKIIDASLREVTRSNVFAEIYTNDGNVLPGGVRPSMFGANTMIDFVWLKNGFEYDKGGPHLVNIFGGERGVSNIKMGNTYLNISASGSKFTIDGTAVPTSYETTLTDGEVRPVFPEDEVTTVVPPSNAEMFPNPVKNIGSLKFSLNRLSDVEVKVLDMTGKMVNKWLYKYKLKGEHTVELNMEGFMPGVYIYTIKTNDWTKSGKFIKN